MFLRKLWATIRPTAKFATASMHRPANEIEMANRRDFLDEMFMVGQVTRGNGHQRAESDSWQMMPLRWGFEKGGMSTTPRF